MNIAIIGTGYVGLASGACFAEVGNYVTCVDIDEEKINLLNKGILPIYEPGLKELIEKNRSELRIRFTTNLFDAVQDSDVIMIAVGTPSLPDGNVDLSYVRAAAQQIGQSLTGYKIIVNKSTVPVGTADLVRKIVKDNLVNPNISFEVASVPEFLREGSAVQDIFHAERIIIGADSEHAKEILVELHRPFKAPIQVTDTRSAELIKYAANAFLAMKISFINEIANIADQVGADIVDVAQGIGSDSRIGHKFLKAGIGFGGSCFPKDTLGLISMAKQAGRSFSLLEEVIRINERQYEVVLNKLEMALPDLKNKRIAILGLAFKPNTNDMRGAPSISIIRDLMQKEPSVEIRAYDPVAIHNAKSVLQQSVKFCSSIEEAVKDADAAVIVTEWEQIISFGLNNYKRLMLQPIIIDGRNCFSLEEAEREGIQYYSVGRRNVMGLSPVTNSQIETNI